VNVFSSWPHRLSSPALPDLAPAPLLDEDRRRRCTAAAMTQAAMTMLRDIEAAADRRRGI